MDIVDNTPYKDRDDFEYLYTLSLSLSRLIRDKVNFFALENLHLYIYGQYYVVGRPTNIKIMLKLEIRIQILYLI